LQHEYYECWQGLKKRFKSDNEAIDRSSERSRELAQRAD